MAKRVLPAAAVGVFMLLLIVRPDYFLNSAARGLLLFASSVLPAIFPFFFCSSLLTAMGAANSLSRLGARPVGVLFNSPPAGAYVLALSMLSGYPIGAATLSDLFRRGIVDAEEVKRIASFTSTSGPIFILGTVGSAVFGDPTAGAVILAAHYLAALTTGLVFRGRRKASGTSPVRVAAADADSALQQSIASSTLAMLAVGGYIVVGNMLIDALALTGIDALLASLPDRNAGVCLEALINGAVEMTRGTMCAARIPSKWLSLGIASAIVSFGGLSVLMQSHAFLGRCGMPFRSILARKFVQSVAGFAYAALFSLIFFTHY